MLGKPNPQPTVVHLEIYGARAYPLIPKEKIPKLRKLLPRAEIGYLVGYDSTNIFRIWIPSRRKVIRSRDVTFNPKLYYDPNESHLTSLLREEVQQIVEVIDFSSTDTNLLSENIDLDSDLDLDLNEENTENAEPADSPATIGKSTVLTLVLSDSYTSMLLTPEETPEPSAEPHSDLITHTHTEPHAQLHEELNAAESHFDLDLNATDSNDDPQYDENERSISRQ